MSYRNRLDALESIARKRPTRCSACGRETKHTPEFIVLDEGEELGRCPTCSGHLSPFGEPVGEIVDGKEDITIISLIRCSEAVPEPPLGPPDRG